MSDIYRIYGPDAKSTDDTEGYLAIDRIGDETRVQIYDTQFHVIDTREVHLPRFSQGFSEAIGMDREHSYVIMYDMDFYRMQKAQKQREYRARRKAIQEQEKRKKQETRPFEEILKAMREHLLFSFATEESPEDLYQASNAAEAAGRHALSVYIRQQGERMERNEIDALEAVRNVVLASRTDYTKGGERHEEMMVAEGDMTETPQDMNSIGTQRKKGDMDL